MLLDLAPFFARHDRGSRIGTLRKTPKLMTSQIGSSRLFLQNGEHGCAWNGRSTAIA
jgi:hypothetical protein